MRIDELSTRPGERHITVTLGYEEVRDIANGLFLFTENKECDERYEERYNDVAAKTKLLFDMIKHGNIEPLTVEKLSPNTLSKEEIETFNHYLLNDINLKIALGNSDFRKIYRKIAGSYTDESIRTIMNDNE